MAVDEVFPHVDCGNFATCNIAGATPIDLAEGATATVDMQVQSERTTITGRATSGTANGPAVKLQTLSLYDSNGRSVLVENRVTNADGTYAVSAVSRATAFHVVAGAPGLIPTESPSAAWLCGYGFCPTMPPVPAGTRANVDFVLLPYGTIRGTVREEGTNKPITTRPVKLTRKGTHVRYIATDAEGRYAFAEAFGPYEVTVEEDPKGQYSGEVYPDRYCIVACNPLSGTPVTVPSGGEAANIDFSLDLLKGGTISGTVKDVSTGRPIANAPVRFAQNGADVATVTTSTDGRYAWTRANGSYHVYVPQFGTSASYWGQVYPGKDCNGACNASTGTLVTSSFNANQSGIDFQLTPAAQNGGIAGTVVDHETGLGLAKVLVRASNPQNSQIALTDAHGAYQLEPLPAGDYHVIASATPYFDAAYGDGALVRVTPPTTTTGIEIRLVRLQVLGVSPASGPIAGGTWIVITGKNFVDGVKVRVGEAEAQIVSVAKTQIVAITPPGPAGTANVTVLLTQGRAATIENAFTYMPGSSKRRASRH